MVIIMKHYVEIETKTVKKIPIDEVINDGIKVFKLLGFYEESVRTDLYCGEAVEETDNVLIKIEQIAIKYGIYNEEKACNDPWYHDHILLPKIEEFFRKEIIIK